MGTGPLPPNEDAYAEAADETWSKDGLTPPAPDYLKTYALASGAKFALVYSEEDFPKAIYIYDCVSGEGRTAPREFFDHIYEMLNEVAIPAADREHLQSVQVVVFLGKRKSVWDFPVSINVGYAKRKDGRWWGPNATPDKLLAAFEKQIADYRARGAKLRGEAQPRS